MPRNAFNFGCCCETGFIKSSEKRSLRAKENVKWSYFMKWVVPKNIHTPPTGNFRCPGRGEVNRLKNIINLCRVSGEGEEDIVNFLRGDMDLFWNNPITNFINM